MTKLTLGSDKAREAKSKTFINSPSKVHLEFSGNPQSPKNGFDTNLKQKHPFFGLREFPENSSGTSEDKFMIFFDSAWRALSDSNVSLIIKKLLGVENCSLIHCDPW